MTNKLTSKDFINIGIFSALYLSICIVISGITMVPILQYTMMPTMALLIAPVYLLYIAKVGKPLAISITGVICSGIVGFLVYGNVYCFLVNMLFFIVADGIASIGKYKSNKWNAISYIVSCFWAIGEAGLPWVASDYYYDLSVKSGYSIEWADGVKALATPANLVYMCLGVVLCAIISILFSNKMFKKHFKKAGII